VEGVSLKKNNVEKYMPQNIDELKQFMVEKWERIPQKFMKNRCGLILENNSNRIRY